MKKALLFCCLLSSFLAHAQDASIDYKAASIADNLREGANAVYRLDESELEVISPSKYTLSVHQVVTILNQEGAGHLRQSLWFNKFRKIDAVEIKLFDSEGNLAQKFSKKDFMVQGYEDGISLIQDDKVLHLTPSAPGYPCTIDVKYIISTSGYINLPGSVFNNYKSSIEDFKFVVKVPKELDIRQRCVGVFLAPVIQEANSQKTYTWLTKNIAARDIEEGGFEIGAYLPRVQIGPNAFEYDGYKGMFKTWKDFGAWNYALYEEKKPFSGERLAEIKNLTEGIPDVRRKIAVLYKYMQKNMRYVSIQLGIGGFKPFPVRFVDEKKYGDCKALTNYMRNLLAVEGIQSYPALINAKYNKPPADPSFPTDVFNHAILCVPNGKDTVWLECTSKNSDAGFLGSETENKHALLLTENGGVLVSTPKSNYLDNVIMSTNKIDLNEDGSAVVRTNLKSSGSFFELVDYIVQQEKEKHNDLFVKYLHYKQPQDFEITSQKNLNEHEWALSAFFGKFFDFKAGNKLFFSQSISKLYNEKPKIIDNRQIEYVFRFPYKKIDTTIFHLKDLYSVDHLPKTRSMKNEFVEYDKEVYLDVEKKVVTIVSRFSLKKHIIPPKDYKAVAIIFDEIDKTEGDKIIFKKESGSVVKSLQ